MMKLQTASKSTAQVNLKPKLKRPDKDAEPADVPHQAQDDPKFAKQIMGFKEWCEKVWDRREVDNGHGGRYRRDVRPS